MSESLSVITDAAKTGGEIVTTVAKEGSPALLWFGVGTVAGAALVGAGMWGWSWLRGRADEKAAAAVPPAAVPPTAPAGR